MRIAALRLRSERLEQAPPGVLALAPALAVVALKGALTFAVAGRYGWHRDELYYAVSGLHLQGGYVEFPPMTALLAALARVLFGWSLVGLRAFTILAGAATVLVGVLVARELGASRRAQTLTAVLIAFCPGMLATNWPFQPVALDQLTTLLVLWLAVRLARGRGSWPLLGLAAGIGLETKYTLTVVLVLLIAAFLVWRRDALSPTGLTVAVAIALVLMAPNLVWEAQHGWTSVHFVLHPPPSGSDETRSQFIANLLLLTGVATPVAVAGVMSLLRDRILRPLGWTVVGTVAAYFLLGGKSYYTLPVIVFALAAGSIPLDRWLTRRRFQIAGAAFVAVDLLALPILLPVLPLRTAERHGVISARGDYQSEIGWPDYVHQVERLAAGADVIVASNYGEAGALELFGHGLPPVASVDVTMRYWRPAVTGRAVLLVGYTPRSAPFCTGYRLVGRIATPKGSDERGQPIAHCTLDGTLAHVWPRIIATSD
ncbi:MAG TPA: glycosyltransferase family 39 protein [Solirubrobacteraceae bacterium]|nr:glycosyltransferase family 39 protein [Solirubrobacteraceae bacterium]